jgi:hypothetical protein
VRFLKVMSPTVGLATSEARIFACRFSGGNKCRGTRTAVPISHRSGDEVRTIDCEDEVPHDLELLLEDELAPSQLARD